MNTTNMVPHFQKIKNYTDYYIVNYRNTALEFEQKTFSSSGGGKNIDRLHLHF